jgi:hypothetical protein
MRHLVTDDMYGVAWTNRAQSFAGLVFSALGWDDEQSHSMVVKLMICTKGQYRKVAEVLD